MNFTAKNKRFIWFIVFILLPHLSFAENEQNDETGHVGLPVQVTKGLQNNIESLDPISVVWTQQRSSTMDLDTLINQVKAGPGLFNFFEPEKNIFMCQGKCLFLYTLQSRVHSVGDVKFDEDGKAIGKVKRTDVEVERAGLTTAMDSHNYYNGVSEKDTDKSTGLSVYPIEKTMKDEAIYPVFLQSYLPFIGFKFPTYGTELKSNPSSYILFLLDNGKFLSYAKDVVDNEQLLRIDIESNVLIWDVSYESKPHIFSCWVDPKYNYAMKRMDIKLPSGELVLTANNSDFKIISGKGVYLPQRTRVDYFMLLDALSDTSKGPLYTQEYTLINYSTKKINPAQFDLRNTFQQSGVMVSDRTLKDTDGGLTFFVPANPADLDRVIEAALTGKDFIPTPLPSTGAVIIRWLLCIIGIVMIGYACYMKFVKKNA